MSKRCLVILLSLSVIFAGAVSAWASCKGLPFESGRRGAASISQHTHEHGEHNHQHSHHSVIHCPTLDEFVLSPLFVASKDHRVEKSPDIVLIGIGSQYRPHVTFRLIHGPPGLYLSSIIPPYLLLSNLRI